MSKLFLIVLNMSLTASYVILFVILIRLLLKKTPKIISYALWGVVAFRLIIPFSFESMFSLMPRNTNAVPIPHDIIYQQNPQINSGIEAVDSFVSQSPPAPNVGASVNPLQVHIEIGVYIWVIGIIALLVYSLVSILILKRQLKNAQLIGQNIYESENLKTPFVLGLIKPNIYLPVGLNATERSYILLHEQAHIHRKDHIIKILAFLILSIHWFNPLVWIAFILMSTDMELSCDEQVLKEMHEDIKKPYANSLLSLATGRHILNGSPLAFGEGNVRGRIKNVLNYKKPRFWIVVISIMVVTVVGIGLMANPINKEGILSNVLNQDGYATYEIQKPVTFTAYIESTWIPKNENEVIELNKEIGKVGKVGILLESVMHRGNDIYFNFDAKQFINYDSGEFLYNAILNEDGTITSYNLSDSFNIYDKNTKIDVGQRGFGPGSKFSFGIDIENYDVIKDGFTLEYKGSILYGYSLEGIGGRNGETADIAKFVEDNLNVIMSSPKTSSNPQDYINAHKNEYENFLKYGGEDALQYMLSQFEAGNAEGLRGQIMMRLCKELLGKRNNVTDESLSPQEWYDALSIRQEIKLPNYEYDGRDLIEQLVYDTEIEKNSDPKRGGFMVVAPKIFGSYEEEDLLKVFVTTYSARYKLYGNTLSQEGGSVIPSAITYRKDDNGRYILEKYEQAKDGSEFGPSIRKYCTMPVSKKEIKGLADKILKHYGDYEDIRVLMSDNLLKHLRKNGIKDATLTNYQGEIEFSMSNPKYKP